jgi:segregation and condensation protein A
MGYEIKLDIFEGPLDLLLYLIRKNEIDIYNIPIALITGQYLSYLDMMRSLNLDLAGEYLVLASTLIHIKSKLLLPPAEGENEEEEGEDPSRRRRSVSTAGPFSIGMSLRGARPWRRSRLQRRERMR